MKSCALFTLPFPQTPPFESLIPSDYQHLVRVQPALAREPADATAACKAGAEAKR